MPPRRLPSWRLAITAATALCAVPALVLPAHALPAGQQVTGGSIKIETPSNGNMVITQKTDRGAIDWNSFSIGKNETLHFKQPSASAITLNRVTGTDPSRIMGKMTATGQVWLVNPNGVMFGKDATVDTSGLVASTAGITPGNFMSADKRVNSDFSVSGGSSKGISIEPGAEITIRNGGLAAFVAPAVRNAGQIVASVGKVSLAAGDRYTLDLYGDGLVKLAVDDKFAAELKDVTDPDQKGFAARVENAGSISAEGGSVLLSTAAASAVVDNLINVSGTVSARAATMQDGRIVLQGSGGTVTVSGSLDARARGTDGPGGTVQVTGAQVVLTESARVNVSADRGAAGTALIGTGATATTPVAKRTVVASGATINAEARRNGKGGTVVVKSDTDTRFGGTVNAGGGRNNGDGGTVEIAGPSMQYAGTVSVASPTKQAGTLTLDTGSLRVTADPAGSVTSDRAGIDAGQTLSETTVSAAALAGKNVVVKATGDVAIDAAVSTGNLEIAANENIGINAAVATRNLALDAGKQITVDRDGNGDGGVTATGSATVKAGTNLTLRAPVSVQGSTALTAGITAQIDDRLDVARSRNATLSITAVDINGDGVIATPGATTLNASTIDLTGGTAETGTGPGNELGGRLTMRAAQASLVNGVATRLGTVEIGGNLSLRQTAGGVTQSGTVTVGGRTAIEAREGGSSILLGLGGNALAGPVSLAAGGDVDLTNGRATLLDTVEVGGRLTLDVLGLVRQTAEGRIAVAGETHLQSRRFLLTNETNSFGGDIRLGDLKDRNVRQANIAATGHLGVYGRADLLTLRADSLTLGKEGRGVEATNLSATARTTIDQKAPLVVKHPDDPREPPATTILASLDPTAPVTVALTDAGNHFDGTITLQEAGNTALSGGSGLTVGGTTRRLDIRTPGIFTADSLTVRGDLDVRAAGGIQQTGALAVTGAADFATPGQRGALTLLNGGNRFDGTVTFADLGTVALSGAGTVAIGGRASNLSVSAGAITQHATLTIAGKTSLTGGSITLENPRNSFVGAISLAGGTVSLATRNDFVGGPIAVGALTLVGTRDQNNSVVVFEKPITVTGVADITGFKEIALNGGSIRQATGDLPARQGSGLLTIGLDQYSGAFRFSTNPLAEITGATGLVAAFAATANDDFVRRLGKGEATQTPAETALENRPEYDGYAANPFRPRYDLLGFDRGDPRAATFARNTPYVLDGFWEGLLR